MSRKRAQEAIFRSPGCCCVGAGRMTLVGLGRSFEVHADDKSSCSSLRTCSTCNSVSSESSTCKRAACYGYAAAALAGDDPEPMQFNQRQSQSQPPASCPKGEGCEH
eukprot:6197156-Pleurochrysis_carterae.AAC.8